MRGRQALALGAVTLLAPCACTLLVSTAGLTGAHDDGDAAGGPAVEAGADAGVDARFCGRIPAPAFCDDFDQGDSRFPKWDDSFLEQGAIALADSGALSSPFALEATVEGWSSGGSHMACLVKRSFPASSRLDYEVAFRSDTSSTAGPMSLHFDINKPNGYGEIFVFSHDGFFNINVTILDPTGSSYSGSGTQATNIPMAAGTWYRAKLHVELGATPSATLTVGFETKTIPLPSAFVPATFNVRAGAYYLSEPSGPRRLLVDDVALTLP